MVLIRIRSEFKRVAEHQKHCFKNELIYIFRLDESTNIVTF
jgi:hypothetical protein